MKLIKDGAVQADDWTPIGDDEILPTSGSVIVSLTRFKAEEAALGGRNAPLGLRLKASERPADAGVNFSRFALIVLEFPTFRDGRGYSHAAVLRQRFGFKGEIRAVGDVLHDQIQPMLRCGIDAFEVSDTVPLSVFGTAARQFSAVYQPAVDETPTIFERRHGG